MGLFPKAELFIEGNQSVVGLEVDMLTGNGAQQTAYYFARYSLAAIRTVRPDIHQIGVADAIGKKARFADDLPVRPGETDGLTVGEGTLQLRRGPPVVEIIVAQASFQRLPIDAIEVFGIRDRRVHSSLSPAGAIYYSFVAVQNKRIRQRYSLPFACRSKNPQN